MVAPMPIAARVAKHDLLAVRVKEGVGLGSGGGKMGDGHVEKADEADGGQPQTRGQWAQTDPKPFVAGSVVVSGRFGRLVFGGGAVFFAAIGAFAQGNRGK